MKRIMLLAALVLLAAPAVLGQGCGDMNANARSNKNTGRGMRGSVAQVLMQMEQDWGKAVMNGDAATLDRIEASDFTFVAPDGTVGNKAQDMADVGAKAFKVEAWDLSDMKVQVFGNTAIVTGATTVKGKYKDQDITGKYYWTDIFVMRRGRWQVVRSQATRASSSMSACN